LLLDRPSWAVLLRPFLVAAAAAAADGTIWWRLNPEARAISVVATFRLLAQHRKTRNCAP